jgi:hypothetical protein
MSAGRFDLETQLTSAMSACALTPEYMIRPFHIPSAGQPVVHRRVHRLLTDDFLAGRAADEPLRAAYDGHLS